MRVSNIASILRRKWIDSRAPAGKGLRVDSLLVKRIGDLFICSALLREECPQPTTYPAFRGRGGGGV